METTTTYQHPCHNNAGKCCRDDECLNYKNARGAQCEMITYCPCRGFFALFYDIWRQVTCCCYCYDFCTKDSLEMTYIRTRAIDWCLMSCIPCWISKGRFQTMEYCLECEDNWRQHLATVIVTR